MKKKSIIIIAALVVLSSCVPQRKLEYLQTDSKSPETYNLKVPEDKKIAPGDYLNIKVESTDEQNFFGSDGGSSASATNEIMLVQNAYLVDSLGQINLPEIGKINVRGLTLEECSDKLQKIVKSYLKSPKVDVRYAFKTYTILGDENVSGRYLFARKDFNILEAIGSAGDLSFYSNRKTVLVLRESNGQVKRIKIDLTDDDLLLSDNYYVQDKDIILINSRNYIRWGEITTPLSFVMSSFSFYFVVTSLNNPDNSN
jgi:polysaccharide biosynthesis/export protein